MALVATAFPGPAHDSTTLLRVVLLVVHDLAGHVHVIGASCLRVIPWRVQSAP
jgi:hypothetical protein